jgi:hypothetical protein
MRGGMRVIAMVVVAAACARHPERAPDMRDARDPIPASTVTVRVPAAARIARSLDTLTVSFDPGALAPVVLSAGPGMVVGMEVDTYVYPTGSACPIDEGTRALSAPPDVEDFTGTYGAKDGIPAPGKRYSVDMDVTIFETDVPPGRDWNPHGERYRALWTRTLHQAEE